MAIGTATAILGGTIGAALIGSNAASKAGSAQAQAAEKAGDLSLLVAERQIESQEKQFAAQAALQEPWRQAGIGALNKLQTASDYTPFGTAQFEADPGYAFRLSEGQKALDRSAAARGGLISGSALKAASRYGQEMGTQEYQNAFNRYQAERSAKLGPLQSLAGVGQTATQALGAAGQSMTSGVNAALGNYGAQAGAAIGAAGQARASGYMGGANALSQGLGQYINYSQGQDRNALFQQMIDKQNPYSGGGAAIGYTDPYARFSYGSNA
jgi:hypothetical protein